MRIQLHVIVNYCLIALYLLVKLLFDFNSSVFPLMLMVVET